MNLKHFSYITAISKEESISKAAQKLKVSQPSLSQTVKKIEEELGCMIFDRSASPMKITKAGSAVVKASDMMTRIYSEMQKEVADINKTGNQTLIVGASPFRSNYIMPGVIKEFNKKYPHVQIRIEEKIKNEMQRVSKEGAVDLAITTLPVDTKVFEYKKMMPEEIVLAIPQAYKINDYLTENCEAVNESNRLFPVIDLAWVKDLDYIMLGEDQSIFKMFNDLCLEAGFEPKKPVVCRNIGTAYSMMEAGVGATVVPYSLIKYADFNKDKVCYYSIKQANYRREMVVIYRRGQYLSDAAKEMLKILTHFDQ